MPPFYIQIQAFFGEADVKTGWVSLVEDSPSLGGFEGEKGKPAFFFGSKRYTQVAKVACV